MTVNCETHGESKEHKLLKIISSRTLEEDGYDVQREHRIGDSIVDTLGRNGTDVVLVECEAFRKHQKGNLKRRFKDALLSFPRLKRIMCIPRIVKLDEIWTVDLDSGNLARYTPKSKG